MNSLQLLSKYRTAVMGFAILWVFIFHVFPYEPVLKYDLLLFVSKFGYSGVDIFLFVSGFGLYFGYPKYKSKKQFYKKRFLRIVPIFIVFVLFTLYVDNKLNLVNFISMFCNIGSFVGDFPTYNWYMTAIMLFYILFPFYIPFFHKAPLKNTIITIIIVLVLNFLIAHWKFNTAIFLTRIPIFCLGIYASYLLKNTNLQINNRLILLSALLAFIIIVFFYYKHFDYTLFWFYGFYWIPFILITPGVLIFQTFMLDKLSKFSPWFIRCLNFLGTISLEIYLIHINEPIVRFIESLNTDKTMVFINTLFVSIVFGFLIHKMMAVLIKN